MSLATVLQTLHLRLQYLETGGFGAGAGDDVSEERKRRLDEIRRGYDEFEAAQAKKAKQWEPKSRPSFEEIEQKWKDAQKYKDSSDQKYLYFEAEREYEDAKYWKERNEFFQSILQYPKEEQDRMLDMKLRERNMDPKRALAQCDWGLLPSRLMGIFTHDPVSEDGIAYYNRDYRCYFDVKLRKPGLQAYLCALMLKNANEDHFTYFWSLEEGERISIYFKQMKPYKYYMWIDLSYRKYKASIGPLLYHAIHSDGSPMQCHIMPDAERKEKERNALQCLGHAEDKIVDYFHWRFPGLQHKSENSCSFYVWSGERYFVVNFPWRIEEYFFNHLKEYYLCKIEKKSTEESLRKLSFGGARRGHMDEPGFRLEFVDDYHIHVYMKIRDKTDFSKYYDLGPFLMSAPEAERERDGDRLPIGDFLRTPGGEPVFVDEDVQRANERAKPKFAKLNQNKYSPFPLDGLEKVPREVQMWLGPISAGGRGSSDFWYFSQKDDRWKVMLIEYSIFDNDVQEQVLLNEVNYWIKEYTLEESKEKFKVYLRLTADNTHMWLRGRDWVIGPCVRKVSSRD